MARFLLALLFALSATGRGLTPRNAAVRRTDARNFERFKDYTFHEFQDQKQLDKRSGVSHRETELNEVLMGRAAYGRLLERDGNAPSEKDAQKSSPSSTKKPPNGPRKPIGIGAKFEKDRLEERRFAREIPEAFDFTLLGEETLDGLPVWKIQAEPKPGFKPKEGRADLLKKVRGTIWVDQAGYQWVRAEIDVIDTISWGLFVLL